MGNEVKYHETVRDVLHILVDRAFEKQNAVDTFDQGVRMGYFEAVSTILNELETFGIDRSEVGMAGFDPMAILQNQHRAA